MFKSRREKIQKLINAGSVEKNLGSDEGSLIIITTMLPSKFNDNERIFNTKMKLSFSEKGVFLDVNSGDEEYENAIKTVLSDGLKREWKSVPKDDLDKMIGML